MLKIKDPNSGLTATAICISALASSSARANEIPSNLDFSNLESTPTVLRSLPYETKQFNSTDFLNYIERINTLHSSLTGSVSSDDKKLYIDLLKDLFGSLKSSFPLQTQNFNDFSEEALEQILTKAIPGELLKYNLCICLANQQINGDSSIRRIELYRIDSSKITALEVESELPLRGKIFFVTPLTRRAAGNFNREFIIPEDDRNSCFIDIGNHLTDPKINDFTVGEPGITQRAKKSELVKAFEVAPSAITYQEQAIRHTIFNKFTENFLAQKGFITNTKERIIASEVFTLARSLFKGELPGYTWARILQRNSDTSSSPKSKASKELFTIIDESIKEDLEYKPGPVTGKLIEIFRHNEKRNNLYDKVIGKIYFYYPELEAKIKSKQDKKPIILTEDPTSPALLSNPDPISTDIKGVVTGGILAAFAFIGLASKLRKSGKDEKSIHINQISPGSLAKSSQPEFRLSKIDFVFDNCLSSIEDIRTLERELKLDGYLSSVAYQALSDEEFIVPEDVFVGVYDCLVSSNEDVRSLGMSFLMTIFDLQKAGLIPAKFGSGNLVSFDSMTGVSFHDWLNIGYPIYRLMKEENLNFNEVELRQLVDWYESEGPTSKTLSFLEGALEDDSDEVKQDVHASWKNLLENIRLGSLRFKVSEQVSW